MPPTLRRADINRDYTCARMRCMRFIESEPGRILAHVIGLHCTWGRFDQQKRFVL